MNLFKITELLLGTMMIASVIPNLPASSQQSAVSVKILRQAEDAQAGFYTPPKRPGLMWDTWVSFHEGIYYMYYLAGVFVKWDSHELAVSEDGVHWHYHGKIIEPRKGTTWMGTGHIWKVPDFEKSHQWISNYSEWFGAKQDIMFATSTDLVNWQKVSEEYRFVQDTRWYHETGRWDCIDTLRREDGSLYGYFTADPIPEKVDYQPCGFGFAESKDGIKWEALPPIEGDITGEFGGIQKIGDRYFITISEGRIAVGNSPEGPFYAQKKNCNMFGAGCDIYFPRFLHNTPEGPLVNHFYKNGSVYAAPLKAVEVDDEGILRLKWWKNNDALKAEPIESSLVASEEGYAASIRMLDKKLDLTRTHVIEGMLTGRPAHHFVIPDSKTHVIESEPPGLSIDRNNCGIFFDQDGKRGYALLFSSNSSLIGTVKADGHNLRIEQTISRDMDFGQNLAFRLVVKRDMMELYVNDYLMNLKRLDWNGRIGFFGANNTAGFEDIRVWHSNERHNQEF